MAELISDVELNNISEYTIKTQTGSIAEVGVYKGDSARAICESKGERKLYLFDTFEGLPDILTQDDKYFEVGAYKSDYEDVKKMLEEYPNVHIIKGVFPETADVVKDELFSLFI